MKIRLKATGNVRDCSQDVGDTMVASGLAVALNAKESAAHCMSVKPPHFLNWSTAESDISDGGYAGCFAPILRWRCQECSQITIYRPVSKPAALSTFHWGHQECPEDVAKTYLNLFAAWVKRLDRRMKSPAQLALESAFKDEDRRLESLKSGAAVAI